MKYLSAFLLISMAGCASDSWTIDFSSKTDSTNSAVVYPTVTYPDWVEVQSGVLYKQKIVSVEAVQELIHIVRLDQTQTQLQLAVNEDKPQTVSAWAEQLGASVLINGSYFDENYQLVTRTVSAGESYGALLTGATGVAQVEAVGDWTITPWSGQAITAAQAIQSYPLLITDRAVSFTSGSADVAQRTVLAMDNENRLYFIVCEYGVLSLAQLAMVLSTQLDVSLVTALNLDGGTSTGLVIQSQLYTYTDDSLIVPSVLYIKPAPGS